MTMSSSMISRSTDLLSCRLSRSLDVAEDAELEAARSKMRCWPVTSTEANSRPIAVSATWRLGVSTRSSISEARTTWMMRPNSCAVSAAMRKMSSWPRRAERYSMVADDLAGTSVRHRLQLEHDLPLALTWAAGTGTSGVVRQLMAVVMMSWMVDSA